MNETQAGNFIAITSRRMCIFYLYGLNLAITSLCVLITAVRSIDWAVPNHELLY
jgi:hypothetical protein